MKYSSLSAFKFSCFQSLMYVFKRTLHSRLINIFAATAFNYLYILSLAKLFIIQTLPYKLELYVLKSLTTLLNQLLQLFENKSQRNAFQLIFFRTVFNRIIQIS